MATLTLDIVDGTRIRDLGNGKIEYTVVCLLHGASGGAASLADALSDTTTVTSDGRHIPQYYDAHPYLPSAIVCLEREAECAENDPGLIRIVCHYGLPDTDTDQLPPDTSPPNVEGGVSIQEFDTEKDVNGNTLRVGYNAQYSPDFVGPPDPNAPIDYQTGTVKKQVPLASLRFSWRQTASPGVLALTHVGTTNADMFQGLPVGTWLCAGITFFSTDLGASWNVNADFLYNEETWDGIVAWIDDKGKIPGGVGFYAGAAPVGGEPGGLKRYVMYRSSTFADIFIAAP